MTFFLKNLSAVLFCQQINLLDGRGYLPIVLIIIMATLLWGLVNYNSFVSKKSQAVLEQLQLEKAWNQRSTELLELHTLLKINGLSLSQILLSLANDPEHTRNYNLPEELATVKELASHTPLLASNPDLGQVLVDLEASEQQVLRAGKKYRIAAADYNRQVREMPSRYIALLFGFKSLET